MIGESVAFLKRLGREVVYDAEHFFDGYRLDAGYALATLAAAESSGADCLVLCDTNGGELPDIVAARVAEVRDRFGAAGYSPPQRRRARGRQRARSRARRMHTGAGHHQRLWRTVRQSGPRPARGDARAQARPAGLAAGRVGSTDGGEPVRGRRRQPASRSSRSVCGRSAFAHKAGIHVAAIAKLEESYQHVDPAAVGNEMRVVVSEVAGRTKRPDPRGRPRPRRPTRPKGNVLQRIKDLEHQGFQFEAAEGSFEMLVRRAASGYRAPFDLEDFTVVVEKRGGGGSRAQATGTDPGRRREDADGRTTATVRSTRSTRPCGKRCSRTTPRSLRCTWWTTRCGSWTSTSEPRPGRG